MNAMTEIRTVDYNPAILETARRYLGLKEWPGADSNPAIERMWERSGMARQKDDVPWCATFGNAVLAEVGLPGTGKPNARSFLKYGTWIPFEDARPGDLVILWRGTRDGWQGHFGFLTHIDFKAELVTLVSGNHKNAVTEAAFPFEKVLGIRRADGVRNSGIATLRQGNRSPATEIQMLQADLQLLGYFAGAIDGLFGPLTRDALMAFQADNGLVVDAIAGPLTRIAIKNAKPRPVRAVTEADLRNSGSRTIKKADETQTATTALTVGSAVMLALEKADDVSAGLNAAGGVLEKAQALMLAYWPVLLVLAVGAFAIFGLRGIRKIRTGDAISGANLGR